MHRLGTRLGSTCGAYLLRTFLGWPRGCTAYGDAGKTSQEVGVHIAKPSEVPDRRR